MTPRVAITGIGVVTPLGNTRATFRAGLLAGRAAAGRISLFDPASLPTRIAAQVDAAALAPIDVSTLAYHPDDRKRVFGHAAARDALLDADRRGRSLLAHYGAGTGGLSLGIGLDLFSLPNMIRYVVDGDPFALSFLQQPAESCVHSLCREFDLPQPPLTHVSACAASTDAIGVAYRLIASGRRRWMLAGGTDSMINPMGVAGFCKIRATTTRNEEPGRASRPFDRDRDGFLLGEGAALLVLEPWLEAEARGAAIYGEVAGYGNSFDAYGISEPHPEGEGALLAMQRALADAGIGPEAIGYVNAHGTSTPKNDPVETLAIRRLLGPHADRVAVSSTKSMIGHLISASGAVETAAVLLCGQQGLIHPTINLQHPDPACDLDYVAEGPRALSPGYILKNSFAFGGQNAALVLRVASPAG